MSASGSDDARATEGLGVRVRFWRPRPTVVNELSVDEMAIKIGRQV